jgi:pseudouridine 5'-phosphatase
MDGLLLDTEDIYTLCVNLILEKYQRPKLPWTIKAKLQGRPGPAANALFTEWYALSPTLCYSPPHD